MNNIYVEDRIYLRIVKYLFCEKIFDLWDQNETITAIVFIGHNVIMPTTVHRFTNWAIEDS